jgi:hypothetical protein
MSAQRVNVYYFSGIISGSSGSLTFTEKINDFGMYSFTNNATNIVFEFNSLPFGELNAKRSQITTDMSQCLTDNGGGGNVAGNFEFSYETASAFKMYVLGAENQGGVQQTFSTGGVLITLKAYQYA